ncbi:MAG: hypothetical protein IJJ00_02985 [Erysipelotrichaceae bacterium]|nr:hypothetical protein [Erysipelotrichaceae bacterium]
MTEVKRDGFTFYKSFYLAVEDFSEDEQDLFYRSIIEYALLDKKPSIDNVYLKSVFTCVTPNIDSSIRKYDQRKEASSKGRSKITKSKRKRNENESKIDNNIKKDTKTDINTPKEIYKDYPSSLVSALNDFESMRKQIKKPITDRARKTILKKLHEYSGGDVDTMIEILEYSILAGYPNIYPLNQKPSLNGSKGISPTSIMQRYAGKE